MNLGIVLSALKRYEESERSYETALLHRPICPDCYYNLGVSVWIWSPNYLLRLISRITWIFLNFIHQTINKKCRHSKILQFPADFFSLGVLRRLKNSVKMSSILFLIAKVKIRSNKLCPTIFRDEGIRKSVEHFRADIFFSCSSPSMKKLCKYFEYLILECKSYAEQW